MPNTKNDTATAYLKPIICTWPSIQLLILNLLASLSLPYISRAKHDLVAGPLCSKSDKISVLWGWRES